MNKDKIAKFESKKRLMELNAFDTLKKIGFNENMVLCDLGAGTGIFSLAASSISNNDIHALDISDTMISILEKRKKEGKVENLKVHKVNGSSLNLDYNSCDLVLMVTVFHEISDRESLLKEIKNIKKDNGKLAIIEFYKKDTPMGPPVDHRISKEYVKEVCTVEGYKMVNEFSLGDNYYVLVFE